MSYSGEDDFSWSMTSYGPIGSVENASNIGEGKGHIHFIIRGLCRSNFRAVVYPITGCLPCGARGESILLVLIIGFALTCGQLTGEAIGEVKPVASMHQRKAEMAKEADAFITLPGSCFNSDVYISSDLTMMHGVINIYVSGFFKRDL